MSTPANPLDKFVTYTYHFELYVGANNDELAKYATNLSELTTERTQANGALMINSRFDAHQIIDQVKITTRAAFLTPTGGNSYVSFEVTEPGGVGFFEKITKRLLELNVPSAVAAIWGLKPIFVGRKANNEIEIIPEAMIYMNPRNITSSVNSRGSQYHFEFSQASTGASSIVEPGGVQEIFAYTSKTINFEAATLEDAFKKVEKQLNEIYELNYTKYLDPGKQRKLKYVVKYDDDFRGKLESGVRNSFADDEPARFSIDSQTPIATALLDLILKCPEMSEKISKSKPALNDDLHRGAFIPIVISSVIYHEREVELRFNVTVYKGADINDAGTPTSTAKKIPSVIEFDYLFSEPGKNVDVMGFDFKFNTALFQVMLNKTKAGLDTYTNISGTNVDKKVATNYLVENKTQEKLQDNPVDRQEFVGQKNGIATSPISTSIEDTGFNSIIAKNIPKVRLSGDVFSDWVGVSTTNKTINLTIRGHKDILAGCITRPDEVNGLLGGKGLFLKVNIFYEDEDKNKVPFFYTGYYSCYNIDSIFSGGLFTQHLTLTVPNPGGLGQSKANSEQEQPGT